MSEDDSTPEPWQDPIIAEVRQVREALFAESGFDVHEFFRRLAVEQTTSSHPLVPPGTASSPELWKWPVAPTSTKAS